VEKTRKENVISRVFKIAVQGKTTLLVSCLASVVGMLAGVVPYLSVYFIARQLLMPSQTGDSASVVLLWVVVAGVGTLLNMLLTFLGSYGCHRVAFRLLYNFRLRVMEHIGCLSMGFFSENTTGSVQKTMDENIEKIEGFVAHMLPDIIGSAVVVVTLFGSLLVLNGWLALAAIVSIAAAFILQRLVFGGRKARQLWTDVAMASKNMTGAFSEYVKGMAEVKLFGLTGTITRALEDNIDKYRSWELRSYRRNALPMSAYTTIVLSLLTFVLPVGIVLIVLYPNVETLLAVLMALILAPAIYDPLMTCVNYGTQMGMLAVGLDAIDEILDIPPIPTPLKPQMPQAWDVTFEDVSFSYQDLSDPLRKMALSHIDFTAPQGQMTALVGPSGGGKSTVGQLLSRFWDVESGRIAIGGVDIRQIDPLILMDQVAIVFQDTWIFADTVLGNITMNRPYGKEQVEEAARAAQCHDFIGRLPDGYETRIGTGGASLSGGEVQRLSIARAILKNSPIVVLDEALAYSDAENENLIQRAIHNLVRDKTVLIIAHRLQSVRNANQILLLHNGRITERGTHDTLMDAETEYRTLWELQHEADAWAIEAAPPATAPAPVSAPDPTAVPTAVPAPTPAITLMPTHENEVMA
jgi:ATP-binding cassette subfamily B protein